MSQAGLVDIEKANPQIATQYDTDDGSAVPLSNTLEILGNTVANGTDVKPLYTTGSGNTVTVNVQVSTDRTGTPLDKNDAGIASFDDQFFSVDSNGYVTFLGGMGDVVGLLSDQGLPSVGPDGNGNIGVLSGTGINTTGQDPSTAITVHLDVPVIVSNGGTGSISLTDGGILLGSGTGAVTVTAQPINGQVLIGSTGTDPVLNTLTEGTGIDIANAAGSITISVDTSELPTIATTYTADSGSAVPALSNLNIRGGEGIDTSGAGSTITITGELATAAANVGASNIGISSYLDADFSVTSGFTELADTVVKSVAADSGSATPSGHSFTISGGIGLTTSGSGSTITINSSGGGFNWNDVTGTSSAIAASNGYVSNNAGLVTLTLPASAAFGDAFRVAGLGVGGWRVAQNAGQTIHIGSSNTTTGAGGRLDSTNRYDALEMLCVITDTDFVVLSSIGNITVT